MVLQLIFGLIILAIAVFIFLRTLGNILTGVILIALVFIASYFIIGSLPNLQSIPVIGQYLPKIPTSAGEAIAYIKDIFYNIDILGTSRDSNNNLLVTVANTGRLDVSNITVIVDSQQAGILNNPKDPLKSKEVTVIQTNWNKDFQQLVVKTNQATVTYG
jgi:hypothetical protein